MIITPVLKEPSTSHPLLEPLLSNQDGRTNQVAIPIIAAQNNPSQETGWCKPSRIIIGATLGVIAFFALMYLIGKCPSGQEYFGSPDDPSSCSCMPTNSTWPACDTSNSVRGG